MFKMRLAGLLTFISFYSIHLFSQIDTVKYQIFSINGSYGIMFISNENLQQLYKSKSDFLWSVGFMFGDSDTKLHPFMEYATYRFSDSSSINGIDNKIILRQNIAKAGLIDYIPLRFDTYARVKTGISLVSTNEDVLKINNIGVGFYLGIGIERRLVRQLSYYLDVGYDFRKIQTKNFNGDYGGFRVEMGVFLNLLGKEVDNSKFYLE